MSLYQDTGPLSISGLGPKSASGLETGPRGLACIRVATPPVFWSLTLDFWVDKYPCDRPSTLTQGVPSPLGHAHGSFGTRDPDHQSMRDCLTWPPTAMRCHLAPVTRGSCHPVNKCLVL